MEELSGRTCVLTGASRGIGPRIGHALAKEGMNIALVARSRELLDRIASELGPLGSGRAMALPADLRSESDRQAVVERTRSEFGGIDVLVNNAAVINWTRFHRQPVEMIQALIETNLLAPLALTRLVLPEMLERHSGVIVNMGSFTGKKGMACVGTMSATKAGLIQWSSALQTELRGTGVDVTVVIPTVVWDEGMFARGGVPPPRTTGPVSADEVGRAVVRAIRQRPRELFVRKGPTRPLFVLDAISPGLGARIVRAMGVDAAHQRLAEESPEGEAMTELPPPGSS